MRRIVNRNGDIVGEMKIAVPTSEQYSIFRAYLDSRHRDGGMADMTVLDYAMMVEDSHIETRVVEYRRRDRRRQPGGNAGDLIAVALTDVLGDGLSMVYSFFEPDEAARSLGTFMVLDHIDAGTQMGLAYVYLGYWVRGSRKMDYKSRFLPQERLTPDGWARAKIAPSALTPRNRRQVACAADCSKSRPVAEISLVCPQGKRDEQSYQNRLPRRDQYVVRLEHAARCFLQPARFDARSGRP